MTEEEVIMIMMIMRILMRRRLMVMVTEEEALKIQFEQRCGAPDGLREVCHMAVWEKVQIFYIFFSFEKIQIKYHLLVNIFINLNTALTMLMLMLTMTIMLLKVWEDFREVQWDRSTCIRPGTN